MSENRHKVIFFTGAGISAESGIPTFAEMDGIRDKLSRDFARNHPEEYIQTIRGMKEVCDKAEPNAAHYAIAKAGFPVVTMNIDRLHTRAGSENVIEVHGKLPTEEQLNRGLFVAQEYGGIVLYGDSAPEYQTAGSLIDKLKYKDSYFVIVGTSFYTTISSYALKWAQMRGAKILLINNNAATEVPEVCARLQEWIETGIRPILKDEWVYIPPAKLSPYF